MYRGKTHTCAATNWEALAPPKLAALLTRAVRCVIWFVFCTVVCGVSREAFAASVVSVSSTTPNGSYAAGSEISLTITFDEEVTVSGAPQLTLETGAADAVLSYNGTTGSPVTTLQFTYIVAAGHTSSDLDYTSTNALTLNGGTITDSLGGAAVLTLPTPGSGGSLGAGSDIAIDTSAPTLTLTSSAANPTNLSPFTVTFTFSESVSGFTSSDIIVTNGSAGTVSGSGSTYTAPITPSSNGTVTVAVGATAASDLAGNGNTAATSLSRTYDGTAPQVTAVTSSSANGTYVAGETVSIQVNLSEPVTVTGSPRLTLETGSSDAVVSYSGATNTLLSSLTFTYTIASGHQSSDLEYQSTSALSLNGGTILDSAGNAAVLTLPTLGSAESIAGSKAIVIDAVAPSVTSVTSSTSDGSYGAGQTINVQVNFSEPVIVTGAPQITLETGASDATLTYAGTTGSPISSMSFTYTVAAGHNSADLDYTSSSSLVLNSGAIVDAVGNAAVRTLPNPGASGSLGANSNIIVDTTSPTLTLTSSAASVTNLSPFTVTFTFSESVTGFTSSDINVTNGSVGAVSGSGSTYTAPITPTSNGTVTVAVGANAAFDLASNGNTAASSLSRTYDGTAPQVSSVSAVEANGTYRIGQTVIITVTVSEAVTVSGTPQLTLETGTNDAVVSYTASGSTSTVLRFTYTVASSHQSSDLDYQSTSALALAGGTIRDAAGNNLILTLPIPGTANSLGANKNIVIDGVAPRVTTVTSTTPNGTYLIGSVINVSVNFSEPVIVTGTPQITLATTSNAVVNYSGATGTALSTLTFTYTVASGHQSADLNYVNTSSLTLGSSNIRDAAGNPATLTLPGTGTPESLAGSKAIVVDARAPTINSVTASSSSGSFRAGQTLTINVNFSEPVTVTGSPQLTLETGTSDAVLTYSGATGTPISTLPFSYTVQAGHTSSDLNYVATNSFALSGATIVDAVNLAATVTLPALASASSLAGGAAIIIDTTAPTVSLVTSTTTNGSYRATQQINVQVRFSENVNVSGTPQITLETGTDDAVVNYVNTTSGLQVNFTYTIASGHQSGDLDYVSTTALVLNGATIRDPAGNDAALTLPDVGSANSLAGQKAIIIDTTAPTVTLSTATSPTSSIPFTVTISASESILGSSFSASDFVVSNGAATNLTGSGASWTVSIYPFTQGAVTIDLPTSAVTDAAGNGNIASNQLSVTVQTNAPFVSGVTSSAADGIYGIGSVIPIQINFSENVTVSGIPQLTLETGATDALVNYSSGSGTSTLTFSYTVSSPHVSSDLDYIAIPALNLNGGTIRDSAILTLDAAITMSPPSVFGSLGATKAIQVDGNVPTVTGVTSTTANGAYRAGQAINVQVTFSETVTVTGLPQITLETGASDAVATYTTGSGTDTLNFSFTVASGHTSLDLDYVSTSALTLNGGTIRDSASNNASLTLANPGAAGSLGNSRNIVIDTMAPQVTSVSSTTNDGSYGSGSTINVRVTFNEPITVVTAGGTPRIALDVGVRTAYASYVSGTGTSTLDFTYTVVALDTSSDLAYSNATALELNGGTLRDASGNDAVLTLAAPGAANSLNFAKNIAIDTTAPTVTNITSTTANGAYSIGTVLQIQVQLSESVTVVGNPTLALSLGSPNRNATFQSGSGSSTLTFAYTVQAGDITSDLDYTGTTALQLSGATIRDAALNNAILTLASPGAASSLGANKNIAIDTTSPYITGVTMISANGSYIVGSTIDFRVDFSEIITLTGTPTIRLETGDTDADASCTGGTGTASLTFRYTVGSGHYAADLDYISSTALALSGGSIVDVAGNAATTTLPFPGLSIGSDILVDGVAPTISRVTSTTADGEYNAGALINIRVVFPEPVNVTGNPTITLETGSTDAVATFSGGSGGTQLDFTLTVVAGYATSDLDYISTSALGLNGGTIRDIAGNDAVLNLAPPGTTGWLGALKDIAIDTTPPNFTSVSSTNADGRYTVGAEISITVTLNEPVIVSGTPLLTLATGSTTRYAEYLSGSESSTLIFLYTVQAGDQSSDLDYESSAAVTTSGGSIRDLAGNDATISLPTPGTPNSLGANKDITIDTQAPYVTSVAMLTANGTYKAGATIDFTVTFSETVSVSDTPTIALETGSSDGVASYTGGTGTSTLSFRYTVLDGHNSTDLDFTNPALLNLSTSAIVDLAGNNATPTLPLPGLSASAAIVVDTIRPSMQFSSTGGNPTNDIPIGVTITFTEAVTGFEASDISLTNASLSNFQAVSSSVYRFDMTASVDGPVSVAVAENAALDLALNESIAGAYEVVYDSIRPTVTLSSTAPPVVSRPSFTVSVLFSEPVVSFALKDILISNGYATSLLGSGQNYIFKVVPVGEGLVEVYLPDNSATDAAGNPNYESNTLSRTRDSIPPARPLITAPEDDATLTTDSPTFSGLADPEVLIKVFNGATVLCTTTSDDNGQWACNPTGMAEGIYSIHATATNSVNNTSLPSEAISIIVDAIPLAAPTITGGVDTVTTERSPGIYGSSAANAEITILAGDQLVCTTDSDTSGNWSCQVAELPIGRHTLSVIAYDPRDGSRSQPTTFTIIIGMAITGVVTIDDGTESPLSGATVRSEFSTTTSDSQGRFSVIVATSDSFDVTATKHGWRIVKDDEQNSPVDGVSLRFTAVPSIGPISYALWDSNIRGIRHTVLTAQASNAPALGGVTTLSSSGASCGNVVPITTAANDLSVAVAPTADCTRTGTFGLVQLKYNSERFRALLRRSRSAGISDSILASENESEFSSGITGTSYVTFDSAAASIRGGMQARFVENALLIGNVSEVRNSYRIRLFSASGALRSERIVELPAKSSTRISTQFAGRAVRDNGTYEIIPTNLDAPYLAEVRRYGYQIARRSLASLLYTTRNPARAPSRQELAIFAQHTTRALTNHHFEIANVRDTTLSVRLTFEPSDSSTPQTFDIVIPPRAVTRVPFARFLPRAGEGTVLLRASQSDAMVANVILNYFARSRGLVSSQVIPLADLAGDEGIAPFESRLQTDLALTNRSDQSSTVTLTCYSSSNPTGISDITIPPRSSVLAPVSPCFGQASSGMLLLKSEIPGSVSLDLLRYRAAQGLRLQARLR